jgi:hypothetical protein
VTLSKTITARSPLPPGEAYAYRIAGIDVHKAMLAVVVADVEVEVDWQFDRRQFGAAPSQLRLLAQWLVEQEVEEVVMESTAQYWRPVWDALECDWQPTRRARVDAGPTAGAPSRAGAVQSWAARPEARLSRCRAIGQSGW